jgi:FkbM family methyltransferase
MKRLQPFWEFMLEVALYGMNIGPASLPRFSGETYLLKNLNKILGKKNDSRITVFDVGANVGDYAREAYVLLGPSARISCFEPSHATCEMLKKNTRGIGAIAVHPLGFSDVEETLELFSDTKGSGLASVYDRRLDHQNIHLLNRETVRLSTIDRFCLENGIASIHLLKVDVEGHEYKVFKGAAGMIDANAIDVIQFEFGGCNIDSRTFFQDFYYLLNPKYRLFRLAVDGIVPIDIYNEKQEQFRTTNFIAIHRNIEGSRKGCAPG